MVRMRRWTLAAAMAALASWVVAGSAVAADSAVTIAGFAFSPASVAIQVGDSVTWTNQDSTAHTATASGGGFDTGSLGNAVAATPAPTATPATPAAPTDAGGGGGGVTITPAPTDTMAAAGVEDRAFQAVTVALAALGIVMLVGTFIADRRFRGEHHGE